MHIAKQLLKLEDCCPKEEPAIPLRLRAIVTPLKLPFWKEQLHSHLDQQFAEFIIRGIRSGFRIGFDRKTVSLRSRKANMLSVKEHPQVVEAYIKAETKGHEISGGWIPTDGPGSRHTCQPIWPKKHKPDK